MKNNKKKVIISAILAISMCFSLIAGATYALFTSEAKVNIAVTAATVKVTAEVDESSIKLSSMGKEQTATDADGKTLFENGGTVFYDTDTAELKLTNVTPGDEVTFNLVVTNKSNVKTQYRIRWSVEGELKEALVATADGKKIENGVSDWTALDIPANEGETITVVPVSVELPLNAGDKYQGKEANILFTVEAVQGNGPLWNGTADTTWYNDTDTEFKIDSAEQLAGLAELVDGGNNFAGKTIKLESDINLYMTDANGERISFDPIGDKSAFEGTFDGQGHTVENLYQSGWAFGYEWGKYGSVGLFGEIKDATIKNVTVSGAESFVEGGDVGGITGSASGNCTFENITIDDSDFATYNNGNGGIIGWSGAGVYNFKNITITEDVVLAGLWGSFDSSIGGVVGQGEPGATYNFENVDIACRLDVYNDCTASYDYYNYRMCGMIIGRLQETTNIGGVNYPDMSKYNITCNDVTVTYGEWANYHYCEPTPGLNGGRGMRVEPGYSYDGLPADFDHTQCTTNHMALIPFDQIFGGDQIGVKGLKTYNGVTVKYTVSSNDEFAAAIKDGKAIIKLVSGNYVIPAEAQGKELTIIGSEDGTTSVAVTKVGTGGENCDFGLDGSTVVFENITITTNSSNYIGYARCNATYNNCVINGTYTLYGDSVFNDCTFNVTGDVYNIWTWGAPTATFNNCTFNSDGKALLLYGAPNTTNTKLTLNDCTFNDNGGLSELKAAIEIGNDYNKSYELIVNNTTVNGYEINNKGINTGTTLWGNKDSMGTDTLNVVVDGIDVY